MSIAKSQALLSFRWLEQKVCCFFPPSARSQACENSTVGKKEGEQARADKERVERSRERQGGAKRKEMIYSKSYVGRGLLLLRVSPTSLSLCSIYNSMGNCWVGSSEGFCCNWFKMQVVSSVVRKRRKGYPVSDMDSTVCGWGEAEGPRILNWINLLTRY